MGGMFKTTGKVKLPIVLTSFCDDRIVHWDCYVYHTTNTHKFDVIIGKDMLQALGILIDSKNSTLHWDELEIPMDGTLTIDLEPDVQGLDPQVLAMNSSPYRSSNNQEEILSPDLASNNNPDPITRQTLTKSIPDYLQPDEQNKLLQVMTEFQDLFQPGIGIMPGPPLTVEAKDPPLEPYFQNAYHVALIHYSKLREKLERMEAHGIIRQVGPNEKSPWGSPAMVVPKSNGDIRLVVDLREVKKRLRRSPHPMPRIDETFQSIDGFDYATALDLPDAF
jgi:hypothetical protein